MNVESSNSVCWYRLESSLEENDLRLLVDKELKKSQQRVSVALEAQWPHGMHQ